MKIITIVGARPQFIKASMISKAIIDFNKKQGYIAINELILHSGQHYDENMSRIFFDQLSIPRPQWILEGKDLSIPQLCEIILPILIKEQPDYVLLYGDTNTTLAGALAAEKTNIKIIHVEAGLRSFNLNMPEEHNRIETDRRSHLLFCPTTTAVKHLYNEGITQNVYNVGDVMYDSALYFSKFAKTNSSILQKLNIKPKQFNLATIHRAENTNDITRLHEILLAFNKIATPTKPIILPLHPRTKNIITKNNNLQHILQNNKNIIITEPVSFIDMIVLESTAHKILTDSGGIQKEAYFHKTPCITLRDETEWVETISSGWNQLAGCNHQRIIDCYNTTTQTTTIKEYGNGTTANQIVDIIWQKKY
jgi:UDP-GlcNAc3NAcA epimerase